MICLGIDSAGKSAGVALMQDDVLLYECTLNTGLTHSETLLQLVQNSLELTGVTIPQLDAIGVTAGPGSFTGLRIGLSVVKGLAFAHNTPCAPVSTLEALAHCHTGVGTVIPALDARRAQVYWAGFDLAQSARVMPDAAEPVQALENFVEKCKKPAFFVGDGAKLCYNMYSEKEGIVPCPAPLRQSRAAGVCRVTQTMLAQGACVPPSALVPSYHRVSQAERERAERLAKEQEGAVSHE